MLCYTLFYRFIYSEMWASTSHLKLVARSLLYHGTSFVCLHEREKLTFTRLLLTIGHAKTTRIWRSINVLFSNLRILTQHSTQHEQCSCVHLGSANNFLWLLCTNCIEIEDCYLLGHDGLHIYQTTRNCFSEDSNLHRHHLEKLKSNYIDIIERGLETLQWVLYSCCIHTYH
jgi:hypothetical protein